MLDEEQGGNGMWQVHMSGLGGWGITKVLTAVQHGSCVCRQMRLSPVRSLKLRKVDCDGGRTNVPPEDLLHSQARTLR